MLSSLQLSMLHSDICMCVTVWTVPAGEVLFLSFSNYRTRMRDPDAGLCKV